MTADEIAQVEKLVNEKIAENIAVVTEEMSIEAAQKKGHIQKKYFWLCFLLGAVGYLLVVALPDRGNAQQIASDELPDL